MGKKSRETRLAVQQEFDAGPERFWRVTLLDEDYLQGLYEFLSLKIEHKEIVSEGEGDDLVVRRTLHYVAERRKPGVLDKLMRGANLVKEHADFDARAGRLISTVELPVIGPRVDFGGRYSWQPLDGGRRMRRDYVGWCDVGIPLVGRKVQKFLVEETRQSFDQVYDFTRRFLAEHPDD